MQISIDIKGIPELATELGKAVPDLVREITFGIEAKAKIRIQTSPASGKVYPRGKNSFHTASAPGEPPATDTGFLVNSIQAELNGPGDIGTIEVGANYGLPLETGTKFMGARPFMVPSIEEVINSL